MTTDARQSKSYRWWFESHNSPNSSHWLNSTLSELDEKTQAMLTIIEEDADSFAQRAEMYYKKRPVLVGMVEDFYRAHRSLAEQFDNLKHDRGSRRTSPIIARSFSIQKPQPMSDPHKSHDGCLSRLIYNSVENDFTSFSKGRNVTKMMDHPLKSIDGPFIELGYGSEEEEDSFGDSEVDDPVPEFFHRVEDGTGYGEEEEEEVLSTTGSSNDDILRGEIERLLEENAMQKNQLAKKERDIYELSRKLSYNTDEVVEMRDEMERLRVENAEIYLLRRRDDDDDDGGERERAQKKKLRDEIQVLRMENSKLSSELEKRDNEVKVNMEAPLMKMMEKVEELRTEKANMDILREERLNALKSEIKETRRVNLVQRELLEQKDEEKREVIRQLTMAIEFQKGENSALKNSVVVRRGDQKKNQHHTLDFAGGLKGFAKLFGWSQQGSVVPL